MANGRSSATSRTQPQKICGPTPAADLREAEPSHTTSACSGAEAGTLSTPAHVSRCFGRWAPARSRFVTASNFSAWRVETSIAEFSGRDARTRVLLEAGLLEDRACAGHPDRARSKPVPIGGMAYRCQSETRMRPGASSNRPRSLPFGR